MSQITGAVSVGIYVFVISFIAWRVLKATIGIRVSLQEEIQGLDIGEHGNYAYPEFIIKKNF